jgi:hypothetical protein
MKNPRSIFMARFQRFTFLVNPDERRVISALAELLKRSQSDAIRIILLETAQKNNICAYNLQKGKGNDRDKQLNTISVDND